MRISVCHCLDCQKRSGSSFAAQARFPADRVTTSGDSRTWERRGSEGSLARFHFCPQCSSIVWFINDALPDLVAIPVGAFADPGFPPPEYSVYEGRKHDWVAIVGDAIDRYD